MTAEDKLIEIKSDKTGAVSSAYSEAKVSTYEYEVSEDKVLSLNGGSDRLHALSDAFDALHDVSDTSGFVEQADGSLVDCTVAEWEELLRLMRAKGRELYGKQLGLLATIKGLTIDSSIADIEAIVW